jgi:hypothetical protein
MGWEWKDMDVPVVLAVGAIVLALFLETQWHRRHRRTTKAAGRMQKVW